ncbi:MAG: M1 family metallopeptidase [Bacteroidota bacterium]
MSRLTCLYVLLLCLGGFPLSTWAQDLPMTPEIQRAFDKQSRDPSGAPGPAYFTNRASYELTAQVHPDTRLVEGHARITYTNNSPDTLRQLVIRTLQDLYKVSSTRRRDIEPEMETEGFVLHDLIVEGDTQVLIGPSADIYRQGTNLHLALQEPLLPKTSIDLEVKWEFTIPGGTPNRMGVYGSPAFFVGYWYPQIAVYDDVFGWDTLQYNGLQEFYQDIGDFEVAITVPDSILLWASGEWQNPAEILTPTYLERYQNAQQSDTVVKIVSKKDYETRAQILQPSGSHTWRFSAPNVPDVAFALSDYHLWDGTSLWIEERQKRVFIDVAYQPHARDFYSVAKFSREAIGDMSADLPGIPFPYDQFTTFNGNVRGTGGGMEFPTMANNGSSFGLGSAFDLTYHEIAHTYFPFCMGINERRFSWMDEGWAELFPLKMREEKGYSKYPLRWNTYTFSSVAGSDKEGALMESSYDLRGTAYYNQAYYRSSLAYYHLEQYLGIGTFRKALQTYYRRWEGKHPLPYDFFHTFEEVSGEDLDWFWRPWFFETAAPDLAIEVEKVKKRKAQFSVLRKGDLPVPVEISIELENGEVEQIKYPMDIWKDGKDRLDFKRKFASPVVSIQVGGPHIPEVLTKDNTFELTQ